MNIFIDAVSSNWVLILFDNNRIILSKQNISVVANESSLLVNIIDEFLKKNKTSYYDLENIVVVNWPWSFTWIRAIVLIVNTINFIINKNITPINYFDLFNSFPIIKTSSKRDLFVKFNKDSKIEVLTNEDFLDIINKEKIDIIYWDLTNNLVDNVWDLEFKKIFEIKNNINYGNIIKNIDFKILKIIEPLYIKKPLIS